MTDSVTRDTKVKGGTEVPRHATERCGASVTRCAVVAGVAFLVRIFVLMQTSKVPTARHLIGDAAGYHAWAREIAMGDWIGREPFYQAPLYPYVLALWFRIVGESTIGIRALQAVWGAVACGLMCRLGGAMFDRRIGLLSGLTLAVYGPAIFFDGIVQKASLSNLLICMVLCLIAASHRRIVAVRCGVLGVAASLLALTRENAMIWHLMILFWIGSLASVHDNREGTRVAGKAHGESALRDRRSIRRLATCVAAFSAGAGVVILPVGLRNAHVGGEFSLTTFQAGPNFYIGNHRGADGRYLPLVRGHETPEFERRDARALAEQETGRAMTSREVSRYWFSRAWRDIRADSVGWIKLLAYKLLLTFNRYEISDVESIRVYREASPFLNACCIVGQFGVIAPLALMGAAVTRRFWRQLWVYYALGISMTLAVAAFYVLGRYRFPLVPILIPFAAASCVHVWDRIRAGSWRAEIPIIVTGLFAAVVINLPIQNERRLDALAEMNAGVALAQSGDLQGAMTCFRGTVRVYPESPEVNNNLAQALALQERFEEAVKYYQLALAYEPALPGVHYNLGVALERLEETDAAARHFAAALQQDPSDNEAQAALNRLAPR